MFKHEHTPYLSGIIGNMDTSKSITVYKHQSTGKTEMIDHQVYNIAAMSNIYQGISFDELFPHIKKRMEEMMLSDIEKKRTPDYVLKSLREVGK